MGWLSRWAVRRPLIALLGWIVFLVGIGGAAATFGGQYNDSFELPNTE